MPTVSTSSSSTQAQLLPSTSSARLIAPISAAAAPDNSLNTSTSSLSTETCSAPITSNKFSALSTEVHPSVPLPESASNSKPSNICEISQGVKQNSKNRRKHAKVQKPEIEIKRSPHNPNKSYVHYTSEDEDMIVYDVEEDEKFKETIKYDYLHLMTPNKYKKKSLK
ncbi:uncharacterized protein TNCV_2991611 [Trichonephila clavipes]|uniref:Uncharacterized protein n=1 Tax=Trichonephila clavipes TaxID=2585209 RepID=A0A8X6SLR1_TRICX|nr:uncharacterized protein TNCV_2991611 [Trichonephila clavipes]